MNLAAIALCLTVQAVELPRATMSEMAAVPLRQQAPRTIEQRWIFRSAAGDRRRFGGGATERQGAPLPKRRLDAAALLDSFTSDSSIELSPPDAAGAVGPRHVVGAYNTGVVVHDRGGAVLKRVTLAQFWFSNAAPGAFYDPRIVYDAEADRWVVMSILDERSVMLAISEDGDPAGAWRRWQIDERYADFSHLVLTADSIVAATTYWPSPHSIYFIVPRAEAYANPETLTATRIATLDAEATPVASDSGDELMIVADTERVSWRPIDGAEPWRAAELPDGWDSPDPELPQRDAKPLDGGHGRIENAVERNGWIYAVMTRAPIGSWNNAVVWCRIHRATGVAEWHFIDAPEHQSYGYPSLAIHGSGAMVIGFGIFSPFAYASSGYVYRSPFGVTSGVAIIRDGDAPVIVGDRWGDYTTTLADPLDGASFWSVQMHAKQGRFWETAWAKVALPGGRRRAARH